MGTVPATDVVNAGFWRRWGAFIIDSLLLSFAFFVVAVIVMIAVGVGGAVADTSGALTAANLLTLMLLPLYYVAAALYYALQESSSHQATVGKRALGIKVTDLQGNRITLGHAFGRWFAAALSYITLYIGFLIAAFTERKQALHDMVANTLVVDRWAYTDTPERQQRHVGVLPILLVLVLMFVPLLGILAAIAIPAYQDYTLRAKVAMAIGEVAPLKLQVLDFRATNDGACPENGDAGIGAPGSFASQRVAAIDVGALEDTGNCGMQVTLRDANEDLDGKRVWVEYDPGTREWACSSEVEDRYLPSTCRG